MAEQRTYEREEDMPPQALALIRRLMPMLLDGPHPALAALRAQYARVHVSRLNWTGVGFFASFEVPEDVPLADPPRMAGGDAVIELAGVPHGAGCVLFVSEGRLECLEGYCYDDEWPEDAAVLDVRNPSPLIPSTSA